MTMRPPRQGVSMSSALAEAYASAPDTEIVVDTLEFLHPTFLDVNGDPLPIRLVNNTRNISAYLEADAPLNPGEEVIFIKAAFQFLPPSQSESGQVPEVGVQVDNVSHLLLPHMEIVKSSRVPITLMWRPYCLSDLSGPHILPVLSLSLRNVHADMSTMSATAGFSDLVNRRFPANEYTSKKFPGLSIR